MYYNYFNDLTYLNTTDPVMLLAQKIAGISSLLLFLGGFQRESLRREGKMPSLRKKSFERKCDKHFSRGYFIMFTKNPSADFLIC